VPVSALPPLYAIVDVSVCRARGLDPLVLAEAHLRGGARLIQVRNKESGSAAMLALAERIVAAASPYGARVIVNDRADIARLAGAAGVHVGQDDLPPDAVRALLAPEAIVGVSTHTREQIDAALETSATYIAVGPVYGTRTKDTGYDATGLELVRYASGRGKPVVAIGGITLERAPDVIAAGATAVAVISDLLAGRPEDRIQQYLQALA
jgi:thiamine-phosphate pyrophosphorylase